MADTSTVGGVISGYCAIGSVNSAIAAGQRDDDRQHRGEDRPVDEELREHGPGLRETGRGSLLIGIEGGVRGRLAGTARSYPLVGTLAGPGFASSATAAGGAAGAGVVIGLGSTAIPGRRRWRPLTMIFSPGSRPSVTTLEPVVQGADAHRAVLGRVRHGLAVLVLAGLDDVEELPPLVGPQGLLGDEERRVRDPDRQADPHVEARREDPRLGVVDHGGNRSVPVFGSTRFSLKSMIPLWGNPSSSARAAKMGIRACVRDLIFPSAMRRRNRRSVRSSTSK